MNRHGSRCRQIPLSIFASIITAISLVIVSGCQNVDPYYGHVDPDRSLKKAGFISSFYSTTSVGWRHKQKDESFQTAFQDRENRVCLSEGQVDWSYLASIERDLKSHFHMYGIDIFRYGPRVYIRLPGEEAYLVDSPHFNPNFYPIVNRVIEKLNQYNRTRLELIGHADSTGSVDYNQRLSELRAYNLERYLNKFGISPARTDSQGRGEREPLVSNRTSKGRAVNRRVTMIMCEVTEFDLPEKPKRKTLF